MKRYKGAWCALLLLLSSSGSASWISPFISEIHYDNSGADRDEFVAVTAPSDLDITDWQLVLYNGSTGRAYGDQLVQTMTSAGGSAWIEMAWMISGLQNGPDAVALVSDLGQLIDFIAYEGAFAATDGAAAGSVARLLPLVEGGSTIAGDSLQRVAGPEQWEWVVAAASPGNLNAGLAGLATRQSVASPGVMAMILLGVFGLALLRRRRSTGCSGVAVRVGEA